MREIHIHLAAVMLAVCCCLIPLEGNCKPEGNPMKPGEFFPQIPLKPLTETDALSYLGLKPDQYFTVNDISAELVLVEIMNTSCASCKKQVPVYNDLFSLIESNPETRSKIKLIAVAVGNNQKEIQSFRERLPVSFPVLADPDYALWDATGRTTTPLTIYVRLNKTGRAAVVAASHLGYQENVAAVFDTLKQLYQRDVTSLLAQHSEGTRTAAKEPLPIFTEQRVLELSVMSFFKAGIICSSIQTHTLKETGLIYASTGNRNGESVRVFVKPVNRFLPCDSCHDAQFLYIFEGDGKIIDLVPVQLTKYGNRPFTETDLDKLRTNILGKYIFTPPVFDPEVDAVSAATITTSVVYKAISEGKALYEELKQAGLL